VRRVTEFDYALSKTPRYYQINAINRTVEAIAQGQNRAMLVMATGTGKTYTAFQIIWRLWKSGAKKRILFLADNWQRISTHFDVLLDRPEAVDALEQTILQLVVRGLLVPQDPTDEEKSFALPQGWEWVNIDALASVGTGTTPSRDNASFFDGGVIPWVTNGETGQPFIRQTEQHVTDAALTQTSLTIYPVGTLVVVMYGQGKTCDQISELCIPATTNQACAAIVLIEPSSAHKDYVKLVFEKSHDEIRELSGGGAQPNLNVGKATLIPLPPLDEQSRIVTRVNELRALCAELRMRLTASQLTQSHLADALVAQ
jgi:type I restriction enzyme S subunit